MTERLNITKEDLFSTLAGAYGEEEAAKIIVLLEKGQGPPRFQNLEEGILDDVADALGIMVWDRDGQVNPQRYDAAAKVIRAHLDGVNAHAKEREQAREDLLTKVLLALMVFTTDPKMVAHLEDVDPQSLKQAKGAVQAVADS